MFLISNSFGKTYKEVVNSYKKNRGLSLNGKCKKMGKKD
jgi:hypothetical protein